MNRKGLLLVVSAPSGCGKGTILAEVCKRMSCQVSVSATTRSPRPGEIDGQHYYFVTKAEFEERIQNNQMLEYVEYCGNYYGTPKDKVEALRAQGVHVILEIEVQGAMQILKRCPDAVSIFIVPPSIETLRHRLEKRGTEDSATIEKRIAAAATEMQSAVHYQYVVMNDALENAVDDFCAIVRAETCKQRPNE